MRVENSEAYSFVHKEKDVLKSSSSGGGFYCLAHYVLTELNGVVYGSTMQSTSVFHTRVTSISQLTQLLKSKYVQSDIRNTFAECEKDLIGGAYVLYVGTPCQIVALKHFLVLRKIDFERLITVDLICHGAPQRKYYEQYLSETKRIRRFDSIDFRNKDKSWREYRFAFLKNNKIINSSYYLKNPYMRAFLKNYILLESCYSCKYKGENRESDVTIGDFWGVERFYPELNHKYGVSLIVIRNKKEMLLNILKKEGKVNNVSYSAATFLNPSYSFSANKPKDRDTVLEMTKSKGFIKTFENIKIKRKKFYKVGKKLLFISNYLSKYIKTPNIEGKVGVITDYGYKNFGNRLQNYALRIVLKRNGFESINIFYRENKLVSKAYLLPWKEKHFLLECIRRYKIYRASKKTGDKSLCYNFDYQSKKAINTLSNVVIGSDQIWNWKYHNKRMPFNVGLFCANENVNKISYAASIGENYIGGLYINLFKEGLMDISSIGVREKYAVDLLSSIGIEGVQVLDPTLLLDKSDWDYAISKYSSIKTPKRHYVLKYCLKTNGDLKTLCKSLGGYDLIIDPLLPTKKWFFSNHFDFIRLIRDSSVVVTDSYHALIFALIFKKKIILLNRGQMESRFVSLLNELQLSLRYGEIIDFSNCDYSKILATYVIQSITFLKNNLKNKENNQAKKT